MAATVLWSWRECGLDIRLGLPLAVRSLAQWKSAPLKVGRSLVRVQQDRLAFGGGGWSLPSR